MIKSVVFALFGGKKYLLSVLAFGNQNKLANFFVFFSGGKKELQVLTRAFTYLAFVSGLCFWPLVALKICIKS